VFIGKERGKKALDRGLVAQSAKTMKNLKGRNGKEAAFTLERQKNTTDSASRDSNRVPYFRKASQVLSFACSVSERIL
jgi:hypothetical protein